MSDKKFGPQNPEEMLAMIGKRKDPWGRADSPPVKRLSEEERGELQETEGKAVEQRQTPCGQPLPDFPGQPRTSAYFGRVPCVQAVQDREGTIPSTEEGDPVGCVRPNARESFSEMMPRTAPTIPTVAEAVDAKEWRSVDSVILDDIDAEASDLELEKAQARVRQFMDDVSASNRLSPEHFASEERIEYNHPQADPDVLGYLDSSFCRQPAYSQIDQEYTVELNTCTLTFEQTTDEEWIAEVHFEGAYDMGEHPDLKAAVSWTRERAREILKREVDHLE